MSLIFLRYFIDSLLWENCYNISNEKERKRKKNAWMLKIMKNRKFVNHIMTLTFHGNVKRRKKWRMWKLLWNGIHLVMRREGGRRMERNIRKDYERKQHKWRRGPYYHMGKPGLCPETPNCKRLPNS